MFFSLLQLARQQAKLKAVDKKSFYIQLTCAWGPGSCDRTTGWVAGMHVPSRAGGATSGSVRTAPTASPAFG